MMKLKDSATGQAEIRGLLEQILNELENEEVTEVKTYANELVDLTRTRKLAKSGWRPDAPIKQKGKFGIYRQCVYNVKFPPVVGSEQDLTRPAVIVRASGGNTVIVIPLTDEQHGNDLYFNVDLLKPFDPNVNSTALVEQIRVVDKRRIVFPYRIKGNIARVNDEDMMRIHDALAKLLQMDFKKIEAIRESEKRI